MLKLCLRLLVGVIATFLIWKLAVWVLGPERGVIGFALVSVVWGFLLAEPIFDFFPYLKHLAKRHELLPWHGCYFMFQGRQIRFYLDDDTVWVVWRDVQAIFQPQVSERELRLLGVHYAKIPETQMQGISEEGILQLLKSRTETRHASAPMLKFKHWLTKEVFPNLQRHHASAVKRY